MTDLEGPAVTSDGQATQATQRTQWAIRLTSPDGTVTYFLPWGWRDIERATERIDDTDWEGKTAEIVTRTVSSWVSVGSLEDPK